MPFSSLLPAATPRPRVLVVDDTELARRAVARILKQAGYDALCFHSGQAALHCLDHSSVDAVVLDLKMPGMNGWELLYALRQRMPLIPVVVHSAYDEAPNPSSGRFAYLRKPYRTADLLEALERVLAPEFPEPAEPRLGAR